MPDLWVIGLLLLAAFAAGWVDAVSGGGGLLQLPALLLALPGEPPATALGTNKMSSVMGTSASALTYLRRVRLDPRIVLPMAAAAFGGALVGSSLAARVPAAAFRPVILVLLVVAWLWTLLRPAVGTRDSLRWEGRPLHRVVAVVGGAVIGAYDGLLGPGTGAFLVVLLVNGLGYSFLSASATAKIVNVGTNVASLIVFGLTGSVIWLLGIIMGVANLGGGILGARMAVRRGSGFVRAVLLVVVAVLILRLGWETLVVR